MDASFPRARDFKGHYVTLRAISQNVGFDFSINGVVVPDNTTTLIGNVDPDNLQIDLGGLQALTLNNITYGATNFNYKIGDLYVGSGVFALPINIPSKSLVSVIFIAPSV